LEKMPDGDGDAPGKTLNLGLLDRTMATRGVVLPLWDIVLEQSLASGGSEVERCVPSGIDDGGFWRRGATEPRQGVCCAA
jgi:hypothetical protein